MYASWDRIDAVESREVAAAIEALRADSRRHMERNWTWLYNFAGRALAGEYDPDYFGNYVLPIRDLDVLAAVARCIVALHAKRVGPADAGDFVAGGGERCTNPYAAKPPGWDPGTRRLWFKPSDKVQVARMGGTGDRVEVAAY